MRHPSLIFSGFALLFIIVFVSPFVADEISRDSQFEKYEWFVHYYEEQYPRRFGMVDTGHKIEPVRIQSIDAGQTWLVVTKNEQVRGYLHQLYPHLDPIKDFEAVKGVDYGK